MRLLSAALLAAAALVPGAALSQSGAPDRRLSASSSRPSGRAGKAIDNNAMYIRVGLHQIYRVDFAHGCPGLTNPAVHLVTHSHTGSVCSALDLDVEVQQSGPGGFNTPCIASKLTPRRRPRWRRSRRGNCSNPPCHPDGPVGPIRDPAVQSFRRVACSGSLRCGRDDGIKTGHDDYNEQLRRCRSRWSAPRSPQSRPARRSWWCWRSRRRRQGRDHRAHRRAIRN